jgi:hypothetical protein
VSNNPLYEQTLGFLANIVVLAMSSRGLEAVAIQTPLIRKMSGVKANLRKSRLDFLVGRLAASGYPFNKVTYRGTTSHCLYVSRRPLDPHFPTGNMTEPARVGLLVQAGYRIEPLMPFATAKDQLPSMEEMLKVWLMLGHGKPVGDCRPLLRPASRVRIRSPAANTEPKSAAG